jgi:glycosyltransferase involved in cell wall biosynthesis
MTRQAHRIALHVAGPARGGIRSHLALLVRELPAHGYTARLATPKPIEPCADAWSPLSITERVASALSPRVVLGLARLLRALRPAVVHAHGYKAATAGLLASAFALRTPRLVTFHNLWPRAAGALDRAALRAIARRATVIAVSEAVAASVKAVAPGAVTVVIGNGVDVARFAAGDRVAARASLGLEPEEPVVGFFGRLTREKGIDLAVAATARLRAAGSPARLLVAGDGPERAAIAAGAGPELLLLGERDDVPCLLSACDVVLIPSRSEGQSVVALEAMAAGRPVVAARVGGLAALAEAGGGLLVPREDVAALSEALRHLLTDPVEHAARAAAGRAYATRHASASAMAQAVAELYDRVLGCTGR